jgi:phage-related protein
MCAVSVTQLIAEVSIQGADKAQANLRDVGTAATTLQDKLKTIQPYNAGDSVTNIDVAQAKLTLLEEKVAQARDKLTTLQDAANAGEAVKGIPEAEANLVLLQDKAQQARTNLQELQTAAQNTGEGMTTLEQGTQAAEERISAFTPAVKEAEEATGGGFLSAIKETGGGMLDFVSKIGMSAMSAQMVWGTIKNGIGSLMDAAKADQDVMAETANRIKSTGGAAGMSSTSIRDLAQSLSGVTDFSTDATQSAENLLLSFTNIGKNVFPDATKAALDLSQGTGQDLKSSVMQLGKALNDPIAGISALARVGVSFDDQEKQQIKTMMAHNDVAGAQKVILAELSKEFGGSAEAAGKTFAGALDILNNKFQDFKGKMANIALPAVQAFANFIANDLSPDLDKFGDWFTKTAEPALSHFGSKLAEVFHSPEMKAFKTSIEDLKISFSMLLKTGEDVGSMIMKQLGINFSGTGKQAEDLGKGALKALADFFKDVARGAQDFSNWLNKIDIGEFIDGIKQAGSSLVSNFGPSIQNIVGLLKGQFSDGFNFAISTAKQLADWFKTAVVPAIKDALPGFMNLAHVILDTVVPAMINIRTIFQDVVEHAFKVFLPIIEQAVPPLIRFAGVLADNIGNGLKFIMPYVMDAAKAIGQFADEIMDRVAPIIKMWMDNLNNDIKGFMVVWNAIWPYASQILKGVWDEIVGLVKIAWALVAGIIKVGLDLLSGNWKQAWTDIQDMFKGIWDGLKTYIQGMWEIIKGIFSGAWDGIKAIFGPVGQWFHDRWNDVLNSVMSFKDSVMSHFNDIKNGAGAIFHDLINGIIDHLNDGISAMEGFVNNFGNAIDFVSEKLGAGDIIPAAHFGRIPHYAAGTPAGGHPGGPMIVGENGPELVFGQKGASVLPAGQTQALLKAFGIPGYAGGIGDAMGDFFSWIGGGASSVLSNVLGALHIGAPSLPGVLNDMASGIFGKLKDTAMDWITKHLPSFNFGGSGGSPVNVPGNVQSWIAAAMALTGVPGSWAGPLATIAMHESGGDPTAVNLTDINAQMGDPSRGLFQTIGSTFAAYALPGYTNIFDGTSNAAAAIRYIEAVYGSVFNVPGIRSLASGGSYIGYSGGTNYNPVAGTYVVGERGPELMHIPVGASVTPNHLINSDSGLAARLDMVITLLQDLRPGLTLDGQRVSSVLMPYIANNIRYGTGTTGM